MKPVATPESNSLLHGPVDDVDDLPCQRFDEPSAGGGHYKVVRSTWIPSERELAQIRSGRPIVIELDVLADPPPPVRISVVLGDTEAAIDPARDMRHVAGCIRCLVSRSQDRDLPAPRPRRRFGFRSA